jgi:molybdopterin-dependent oxidoreductase alpha subunit
MVRAVIDNRHDLGYAWKVLTRGACDGCALGVAGLHDWGQDGVHLCTTRLRLLEFNTAPPMDHSALGDVSSLSDLDGAGLRALGRLAHPMRRRAGEPGFTQISWSEALTAVGGAVSAAGGERCAVYLTSRGITNEVYYAAAKAARAMGIASIDSAARVCHSPSTVGLKETIGVAATTCSMEDVIESDLIVIWGSNPAANQPVFAKYLHLAKVRGARVVVVNPYLEPSLERYWVPSNVDSALFGTKLCDLHVPVRPGGDVALASALLKRLIEHDAIDRSFIDEHTSGWSELETHLTALDDEDLCREAGVDVTIVDSFAEEYGRAGAAILLWSMGITQHAGAVDGVRAIVNVALARGNVGRDGAGLMPIRGHSGVQGGAEMGAYATAFPGGVPIDEHSASDLGQRWGFEVPAQPGMTAPEMIDAMADRKVDVFIASGGNMVEVLPEPERVKKALSTVPLRVHLDVVVTTQMLVPGDDVILLPVRTRYEQEGGGTETSTERRIIFSPEIPRVVGEAASEWRLWAEIATAVRPDLIERFAWADNAALRAEIADVVPLYAGIETLSATGDSVQWGGRHLCRDGHFATPDGRARFTVPERRLTDLPDGCFVVSTRRGKQFNSIVHGQRDALTGTDRDAVFMDAGDADRLGLDDGDPVTLTSPVGSYRGRVHLTRLAPGSLQVLWPEGNVLIGSDRRDPASGIPDYNAIVSVSRG